MTPSSLPSQENANESARNSVRYRRVDDDVDISRNTSTKTEIDYDQLVAAMRQGLSSAKGKLPKLPTAQVSDIRSFLESLDKLEDLRGCFVRDLIPSFVLQRICLKAEYTARYASISDDDLMDCLYICAYPKYALDGNSVEESLRSTARSVAAATDAANMPRFVGSLFDAMCKFVAEAGSTEFFMNDGDVDGVGVISQK